MSKREDYISWADYFMGVALLSAQRSKDPNTQVGACISSHDKRIIGVGYNGFPQGCMDDQLPWERNVGSLESKYLYVIHAEQNAILNSTKQLKDSTIYVTLFPCNECTKLIIQSGIKEVVYLKDNNYPSWEMSVAASKRMMDLAGVKYRRLKPSKDSLLLSFL